MREKPLNWNTGFAAPHRLSTGEVPFCVNGNWYLYVYNTEIKDQDVFSFTEDRFYSYSEFQEWMNGQKIPQARELV